MPRDTTLRSQLCMVLLDTQDKRAIGRFNKVTEAYTEEASAKYETVTKLNSSNQLFAFKLRITYYVLPIKNGLYESSTSTRQRRT